MVQAGAQVHYQRRSGSHRLHLFACVFLLLVGCLIGVAEVGWPTERIETTNACTYTIDPRNETFDEDGGPGRIDVTTQSGCAWTATSNRSWIDITSGSTGTGSGTVRYRVDACAGSGTRTGTITVAGETFTVTQTCECTYSIFPDEEEFDFEGGTGTIDVTTQTGCSWTATSNLSWIDITSGSTGTGSGTVRYRVDACAGSGTRTGTIAVAGETFTVTQECECRYDVWPDSRHFDEDGGTGTIDVETETGCTWTADPDVTWISITSGASGSGDGTVRYSVAENDGGPRTAHITIEDETHTVTQDGEGECSLAISPTTRSFRKSGGSGTITITTGSDCTWTANVNVSWISITSGKSGTGSGTVRYQVASNSGGTRTGRITIAGNIHTVTQEGPLSPGALQFDVTTSWLPVPEGGTASLGIRLSGEPTGTVRGRVSWIGGDSDLAIRGNDTLTFDRSNYDTYQYVTVGAAPDEDEEAGTATLRVHRLAGDAVPYHDVTVTEDDRPGMCKTFSSDWQFLSLPAVPNNASPVAVFDEVTGTLQLYAYNGTSYDSYADGQLTRVEITGAYWLHLSEQTTICVDGSVPTTSYTLWLSRDGWHAIGVPYAVVWGSGTPGEPGPPPPPPDGYSTAAAGPRAAPTALGGGSITVTYGGSTKSLTEAIAAGWLQDAIYWYDTSLGNYRQATAASPITLDPWVGYWIYALQSGLALTFSTTGGGELPPPPPTSLLQALEPPTRPSLPPPPPVIDQAGTLQFGHHPNPVTEVNTATFTISGSMSALVKAIKVQIFDLSGRLVYEQEESGASLDWHTENDYGEHLANGVYLYKIYALIDGEWIESETKKLVILR